MSGEQDDINLTEIIGFLTSVEDIWSGIGSVATDHSARSGSAEVGRDN